jgi:hypothetical protein
MYLLYQELDHSQDTLNHPIFQDPSMAIEIAVNVRSETQDIRRNKSIEK